MKEKEVSLEEIDDEILNGIEPEELEEEFENATELELEVPKLEEISKSKARDNNTFHH